MPEDPDRVVVAALEAAGRPLDRGTLAERTGLDGGTLDRTLDGLRGQQVVRRLPDREGYRLTYWPDERNCVACGEGIDGEEFYEIELRPSASTTESQLTGRLHTACAFELLDELSLDGDG